MKIRLLKRWRTYPIGSVLEVFDTKAKELICEEVAIKYNGDYPPKKKMKTNFFKPK